MSIDLPTLHRRVTALTHSLGKHTSSRRRFVPLIFWRPSSSTWTSTVVRSHSTSTPTRHRTQTLASTCTPPCARFFSSHAPRTAPQPTSSTILKPSPSHFDLSHYPPERIRNFAIIAHIDHGKSTLADRMLEMTGTIPPTQISHDRLEEAQKNEQVLDTLKVERERGITVRAQSASMFYTAQDGHQYLLNLLDTPGHADFSSELLRSLLPSQGALLLVDAAQGIQAQTLSVLDEARKRNLTVLGAVNKWDLVKDDGRGEAAVQELAALLGCEEDEILRVSAKTGLGVQDVLEGVVKNIPAPSKGDKGDKLSALAFDSYFDPFRGVVSLVAVVEGEVKKGDSITSTTTKQAYPVLDLGILSPREISIAEHKSPASTILRKGMVGYIVCAMKDVQDAFLGDTFHLTSHPKPALESFKPLKSMVFAGVYPVEPGGFPKLEDAIRRLTLTDRSVTSNRESSTFLGQGFRLGFNGSLHMDVFRQRLEDEYGEEVIVTRPLVPVKIIYKNGKESIIDNPEDFPDPAEMNKVTSVLEPFIRATIVAPDEYTGAIINHCTTHRGVPLSHTYLSTPSTPSNPSSSTGRITLLWSLPLSSIVTNFHAGLKSVTSGFASFDYEEAPYEESSLCRLNILINGTQVDALCSVVHKSLVEKEGREWTKRLKEVVPRQQYEVVIQAAVGNHILSRERIAPFKKDVTAKLYGGDVTRKMKLLAKQKDGKKKLKERSIGRVTIPTSAFFAVLGGQQSKRKGGS
ncbi:GTP-binding protein LepA [Microbotryum lychnidis-dioicae p1A1 Lamole]|uniref:GTP-binding protein LepA n=1 Tax=Microbotryum lychnidis-dioicae (strain p1A1 Lamole / MvSl-1064) TaxID=683840 RepID=U5H5V6_USTV1|nr:GTP-binding protein LepA [Microbotryum lychnidis-dioicae p1A1 Lamole]|eukprot:KDE07095.1 GTP-binding protein LepA [Microbotryum lychnidis-dioicae p1A1 Lamole]